MRRCDVAGRFDREIALGIPDEGARARILSVMCREMKLEGSGGGGCLSHNNQSIATNGTAPTARAANNAGFDFRSIAKKAVGYVGADLMALTREAAVIAINRIFKTVLPTPFASATHAHQ